MSNSILLIDNIDSFSFNLVQALRMQAAEVRVMRSDEIQLQEAQALNPTHLILGPGPGRPEAAKRALELAQLFVGRCPILGVCLGHQMLGLIAGASIVPAAVPAHGKIQRVYHDGRAPFRGLPNPFEAARYNSLVVDQGTLAKEFEVCAWSQEGEVLGIRQAEHSLLGLQFHPESILTPQGMQLLKQFLGLGLETQSAGERQQ